MRDKETNKATFELIGASFACLASLAILYLGYQIGRSIGLILFNQ